MNKQELIDKLKRNLTVMSEIKGSEYDKGYDWATKQHLVMIADLDEPEKPVVPQFVADFYEPIKDGIRRAIVLAKQLEEQEKLYTVEIPNPNGFIRLVLCKDCDGKLFVATFSGGDCWENFGKCKLTEAEIKEDFEWAWQFAKEVKE